ncbi:kinase-like protein [Rhizophagus irregularis]|uniref:Kinase-like protein n=1 Tax=Rhizophagus irregularis TaxID=588596 RepID=A0A2N0P717_9GLOM|nr:kinase-like protein [Rhizophagus irregularis]
MSILFLILSTKYRRCHNCDQIVNNKYAFCTNCGNKLQWACPSCKKEITELSTKFCGWCGKSISNFSCNQDANGSLHNIVKIVQEKHNDHQISDAKGKFGNALQAHANIRGFAINKASGRQRQVKEKNKKTIYVEAMAYNDRKNQGEKLNGIPKKIYNFSPEEKIETVLITLINDLEKEIGYTEKMDCWIGDVKGVKLNTNTFTYVSDLDSIKGKITLVFRKLNSKIVEPIDQPSLKFRPFNKFDDQKVVQKKFKNNQNFSYNNHDNNQISLSTSTLLSAPTLTHTQLNVKYANMAVPHVFTPPHDSYHIMEFDSKSSKWNKTNKTKTMKINLPKIPFSRGGMRYSYKFVSNDMPENLFAEEKQYEWVAKTYITDRRNTVEVLSVDVQMQMLCQEIMKRFHKKASVLKIPNITKYSFIPIALLQNCRTLKYFTVEPFIYGEYVKYNSNDGFYAKVKSEANEVAQAFSHFSYNDSGQKLVVVDMQGTDFLFTDPQIHSILPSIAIQFSQGNCGQRGITAFLKSHICNNICEKMQNGLFDVFPGLEGTFFLANGLFDVFPGLEGTFFSAHFLDLEERSFQHIFWIWRNGLFDVFPELEGSKPES